MCSLISVVFASAYRTSVLFTYDGNDPSYTLAPTVGWTAIEMSAGITSACLPTLLPVLNAIVLLFGIKSPISMRGSSKGPTKNQSTDASAHMSRTGNLPDANAKRTSDNFYRLPDEPDSEGSLSRTGTSTPIESKLRPDRRGDYQYTVKSGKREEDSGDDIPLHGIRVQTVFERSMIQK